VKKIGSAMLERWACLAGIICVSLSAAAAAQDARKVSPITPPLSRYGSLQSPALRTAGLPFPASQVVQAAIDAATEASQIASLAEATIRAAERAAAEGRDAARKAKAAAPGYGMRDTRFRSSSCRYSGQLTNNRIEGVGVMVCETGKFTGQFRDAEPDGLVVEEEPDDGYLGQYRHGVRFGLGGDYKTGEADAYEGEFKDDMRIGRGIERDKDGFYPGQFGFEPKRIREHIDMQLFGVQNFRGSHWAGRYASYTGPKIACTLIKGAMLEGSVLDGYAAKFDAAGRMTEQGLYKTGFLENGAGPPC
jgi:hypothetical protein